MEYGEKHKNSLANEWVVIFRLGDGFNTSIRVKCEDHTLGYDYIEEYANRYMKKHRDHLKDASIYMIYPVEAD